MSLVFALPLIIVVCVAGLTSVAQTRLRPDVATQVLAIASLSAAVAWLATLLALTLGALAEVTTIDRWMAWCPNLYLSDAHVPGWIGAAAGVVLVCSLGRSIRRVHRILQDRREMPECGADGLLVLPFDEPTAFAVPGRRGGIVVSRGMIAALDEGEQAVLWAHERAHLQHRHHWYRVVSDLSAAVLPPLGHLARQVHFGTERWADEESARSTGDRRLVARAIAKAAIASTQSAQPQMAMASSAVPARVEALVAPRRRLIGGALSLAVAMPLALLTVGSSTLQTHHLMALVEHVCGGR